MVKEEMVYISSGILFSHKKETLPFATWVELESIMLSDLNQ